MWFQILCIDSGHSSAPLGETSRKQASCPKSTRCNQKESDPWCCMGRNEVAISSSKLARLQGGFIPSTHPPAPSKIMRPVWLSRTMEQRGLQEAAGTCLTKIAAAMNQAPQRTSTSSLHKYPWAQSFAFPHRSPSWGMLLGSWEKCSEVWGMGEELETSPCLSHRTQKKKGRTRLASGRERKRFF